MLATTAARRVTRLIGARKVETQNVPVVVEPPVTAGLLDFLAEALSGAAISRRQSFLVDKLGTKIAADHRHHRRRRPAQARLRHRAVRQRGRAPPHHHRWSRQGVLKSYLLDTYYGRKLGMRSTGNAGGTTNLYLDGGRHHAGGDHRLRSSAGCC